MTNFSTLFSGAIGEGKGINEFMKSADMDQAHLKKPYKEKLYSAETENLVDSFRSVMSILEEVIQEQPSSIQLNVLWPDFGVMHLQIKSKCATNLPKLAFSIVEQQTHDKMKRQYENDQEEEPTRFRQEDSDNSYGDEDWKPNQ